MSRRSFAAFGFVILMIERAPPREHFIRIASGGGIEIVNRDVGRCFGIIHLKPPNPGVVEIEKALRCVRQG